MSHDIFISYSRRDTERMQQVRDILRESGFEVWTDEGIEPGSASWRVALSDAITECTSVVVLFSPDSAKSTWVNRELDFAELHKKKIYPLLVRGEVEDALPFGYTTFQFVDIRAEDSRSENLQRLIATLQGDFPNRQFSANSHPQVVDPTNAQSEEAYHEVVEPAHKFEHKEEISWKPIETDRLRMFVPSTWKISEPTHENWARAMLLMLEDENAFYQVLHDEQQLASQWVGVKGIVSERHKVINDISGLVPLSGIVSITKAPIPNIPSPSLYKYIVNRMMKRSVEYFEKSESYKQDGEVSDISWFKAPYSQICVFNSHLDSNNTRYYILFPYYKRYSLSIMISCQASRFDREIEIYDRMVQSVQFIRG